MQRDQRAYLWDVRNSVGLICQFIDRHTLADYSQDAMLRSAVERQLGIVGEALAQLSRYFPDTASRISECSAIVSFRNRLIHGYSAVADPVVWHVVEADLPVLQSEVEALLVELEED